MVSFPPPLLLLVLLLVRWSPAATADDAESLKQCLIQTTKNPKTATIVFTPTAPPFSTLLTSYIRNRRFNTSSTSKPIAIVTPITYPQVSATVICVRSLKLQLRIRSGGHDYDGLSYITQNRTPFVLLDMFRFNSIRIDLNTETAWVESGATLGELYYQISKHSKIHAFPAGVCPTVGIGGHISGGGYGTLLRKFGLTVDHVIDAMIVDYQGRILNRRSMGNDLFWAIRGGGGGSFGVVLSFKINLVRVPDIVSVFRVERWIDQDNATDIFAKWQQIAYGIDRDLFVRVLVQPVTPKKTVKVNVTGEKTEKKPKQNEQKTIRLTFISLFLGNTNRLISITDQQFPELGLKKSDCKEMNWIESILFWNNMTSSEELLDRNIAGNDIKYLKRKSDYIRTPISKQNLIQMWTKMIELGKTGLVFNQYGGRMAEISSSETPFPHRSGNIFKIQYSENWSEDGDEADAKYMNQIREMYEFNAPFVSNNPRAAFVNYRDVDIGVNRHRSKNESYGDGEVYGRKYFLGNFDRLVKVKSVVDPENFFSYEQSIPVLAAAAAA